MDNVIFIQVSPQQYIYFFLLNILFLKNIRLWKQNVLHKAIYISWFLSIAVMDWIMNSESAWGWVFFPRNQAMFT